MSLTISLTAEEQSVAENYAGMHRISLADAFKKAFFDLLEVERDSRIFEEYEKEKADGTLKTYSHEEVWAM